MQLAAGKISYDDFDKKNFGLSVIDTKRALTSRWRFYAFGESRPRKFAPSCPLVTHKRHQLIGFVATRIAFV
jgi:hypothetical protein